MELRHLRYFVATAELEHFGRAAARLSIVQPALSKQIRQLEAELGTALFERLPRGVRLTAAGRGFLDDARALLQQADAAAQRARDTAAGRAGKLRVGFVDTAIYHAVLPRIFHAFRQRYAAVQLELVQQTSFLQGDALRNHALDIGFVFHRPGNLPTLARHPVARDPIVLAAPAKHPLARRRSVRLAELKDEPFVWIPRAVSPPFYDAVFSACARHGFAPRIVQEGQTDLTILSLVAAGAGLSFCVASAAQRKPRELALVRISDFELIVQLEAIWRTDGTNPALPHFLSVVREATLPKRGGPRPHAPIQR